VQETSDVPLLCFSYQNLTFCLYDDLKAVHAGAARFRRLDFPTQLPLLEYASVKGYVASRDVARAQLKWGKNDFDIPVPRFAVLLKEQLVAPFFVFQFFCMLLWCLDEYVYYSLMTLCMLVVFECTVVKQRQRNMEILNGMRRAPQPLFVYRANRWSEIMSDQLVPGDICSIGQKVPGVVVRPEDDKLTNVPCDLLLLRGNCVVNESMLTGESVPLRKESIASDGDHSDALLIDDGTSQVHKKHVLFGGTKILQHTLPESGGDRTGTTKIPNAPDKGCVAFVLRTGFGTTQGSLMRTILHSSQRVTANTSEAMWFILLLLGFAIAAAGFVLHHGLRDPTRNRFKLVLHCIMIITSVVPPELPMELSLAVTNSLLALMQMNIYCTEPFRIPFAGRTDVCCFDKTGTLTSDELKMHGVAGLKAIHDPNDGHFRIVAPDRLLLDSELVLAGCQSLVFLNGQVMGDPLEATALKNIKWTLAFGPRQRHGNGSTVEPTFFSTSHGIVEGVHILHRFSFSSDLKRMTTIVSICKSDNDEQDELRVLTKGAPEVLEPLFAEKPQQYSHVYRHFASKGCRVLALGYRRLSNVSPTTASVDAFVRTTTRSAIECDLIFAGFLVLDCPLKEDTKQTIRDLVRSNHKIIVITGDNALTACDAARQIGLNTPDSKTPLILQTTAKPGEIEWRAIDDGSAKEETLSCVPFTAEATKKLSDAHDLCVTGEALAALALRLETRHANEEALAFEAYMQILIRLCPFVNVFARTSPQQKEHIIIALNRAGKTTVMCGDGTNDVGALKRAHVGVSIVNNPDAENSQRSLAASLALEKRADSSLQERLRQIQDEEEQSGTVRLGDASIASPFTSKSSSIRVVKQLVRQGRCTLVTTIQMYKILGVNCLITAYYLTSLYIHGVKNGDQQLTVVGVRGARWIHALPLLPRADIFDSLSVTS
jgi:manganese-transporting P-type ATPase